MATSVPQLQPEEQTLRKLTIAEYHKLVEAGVLHPKERVERLDGLLVQMAPIGPRHQSIVDQLTEEFSAPNKSRDKGSPGRPIPIPDFNEPQPDMVLFKRGVPSERHPSPNEIYLVVEVGVISRDGRNDQKRFPRSIVTSGKACTAIVSWEWVSSE